VSWSVRNEYFDDLGNPVHIETPMAEAVNDALKDMPARGNA